ncbi:MAG TPA: DUF72 domain-containing protein [Polyangiaceae bacterium]|jgi:uncharacterized protein YecE (DUF72 family)
MEVLAGTSGFSYPEWRGLFYPRELPDSSMLAYYAERLPSVEINNTFYRMPKPELLTGWGAQVPPNFCFTLKASRTITHLQKLAGVGDAVAHLFSVAEALTDKLGAILFQLPPFVKKDLGLLLEFLGTLPSARHSVLEFRHPSWFADDVYTALSDARVALCAGDLDELEKSPPLVVTAPFGYLRLRRLDYDVKMITDWAERVAAQSWQRAYVYFKHEQLGPFFAQTLLAGLRGEPLPDLASVRASLPPVSGAAKAKSARPRASKAAPSRASKAPPARASKAAPPRASRAPRKKPDDK